ncbi:hypothetical protein [Luteimonas rhizosphaerae]|nr:hypothetical protein [Luteimonas sp. 4-12]
MPQDLHDQLDALGFAVDGNDMPLAARQMSEYDAALRGYIDATTPDTDVDVLRALLERQNALVLRMRERQSAIGDTLRQMRRADTASRAYASAGVSP